jgi:hypothetical protein
MLRYSLGNKSELTVIHDSCCNVLSGESLSPSSFNIEIKSRFSSVLSNIFLNLCNENKQTQSLARLHVVQVL